VGFTLIMMFGFGGGAGIWGCCGEIFHMQSVEEERNQYRCLFLYLVQYGTRGKCPSFCCKDFLVTFLNCRLILTCVQLKASVCCLSELLQGTGQALLMLESQSQKVLGLLGAELHRSAFSSMAVRRKRYRPRHRGTGIRI